MHCDCCDIYGRPLEPWGGYPPEEDEEREEDEEQPPRVVQLPAVLRTAGTPRTDSTRKRRRWKWILPGDTIRVARSYSVEDGSRYWRTQEERVARGPRWTPEAVELEALARARISWIPGWVGISSRTNPDHLTGDRHGSYRESMAAVDVALARMSELSEACGVDHGVGMFRTLSEARASWEEHKRNVAAWEAATAAGPGGWTGTLTGRRVRVEPLPGATKSSLYGRGPAVRVTDLATGYARDYAAHDRPPRTWELEKPER